MKRRLLFLFALVLSLLPGGSSLPAQAALPVQKQQARPAPARQRSAPLFQQAQYVNKILPNGLEVIVLEDHSVPLVTVELAVKNGSYTETPELNGLSHLYEHMFFKSNRAIATREPYIFALDNLGIVRNAETHEEVVNYYFTTTTPNYQLAMRFMRDALRYPLFDEREFERERAVVLGELDRHESNVIGTFLQTDMNSRLFYKYPTRKNPGGTKQSVSAATTELMRTIQGRYYVPNNSAVVVAGDVKPEEAFRVVESLFGDWPRRERDPFEEFPPVEHPPLPQSTGEVIKRPVENVIISLGWHGPSIGKDNPGTYAADVFSFIVRQPDSRFQRALVDTGLVTSANIGYYTQRNVGPINVVAQTTPEKARAALKAIYTEIARFNDPDYYTDEQLETAKALLEADDMFSREKLSDYTHTLAFWWASTGIDYFRGYHTNLRRTSRADISRYVSTYIQGRPHVGLALMSEESARVAQVTPQDLTGEPAARGASAGAAAGGAQK